MYFLVQSVLIFDNNKVKSYFEEFHTNFYSENDDKKMDLKVMKSNGGFSIS